MSAKITKDSTTLVDGAGEALVKERAEAIRTELAEAKTEVEKERLRKRLAKLSGGVAVIKIGASTETEMKEKKLRIEDALNATKAAIEEGIVPGGGTALAAVYNKLAGMTTEISEEQTGINVILNSLKAPLLQIADNAGLNGEVIISKLAELPEGFGYNAYTNQYVDMYEDGIIDPVKVTRTALQNASSVASTFLTTESAVVNEIEE